MSNSIDPLSGNNHPFYEVPPSKTIEFSVEGRVLRVQKPLEELSAAIFWETIGKWLTEDPLWENLDLGHGELVSREKVAEFQKLHLEIPPGALKTLHPKLTVDTLQALAVSKILPIY